MRVWCLEVSGPSVQISASNRVAITGTLRMVGPELAPPRYRVSRATTDDQLPWNPG